MLAGFEGKNASLELVLEGVVFLLFVYGYELLLYNEVTLLEGLRADVGGSGEWESIVPIGLIILLINIGEIRAEVFFKFLGVERLRSMWFFSS